MTNFSEKVSFIWSVPELLPGPHRASRLQINPVVIAGDCRYGVCSQNGFNPGETHGRFSETCPGIL